MKAVALLHGSLTLPSRGPIL